MISKVTIRNFKRFKETTELVLRPEGITFLAGGNNSGKSTLLQALGVWEFSRSVIEVNKGKTALLAGAKGHGVGVSAEAFSPIALPNLKHLFSDLRAFRGKQGDGYIMRIRCDWTAQSDPSGIHQLEFGLALSNDRLFMKCTFSNLTAADAIPRFAYLPSFAGISAHEERMSTAARKRWIGRGLAGAILRNLLYDFWRRNIEERERAKGPKGRISPVKLAELRKTDSWEQLLAVLEEVFKTGLTVRKFDDSYHTTIQVVIWDGQLLLKRFRKKAGTSEKDIMVEGSGFLQWLSVYALALNKELDVLLLDEPDAHLHPELQGHLLHKLAQLARENRKQVLLATHSTTILTETKVGQIFRMEDKAYLKDESGRVQLFIGLGSQYAPRLDQLKRCKRLFLHDGISDLEILQAWAKTLGYSWPEILVSWKYTKERDARIVLFEGLKSEIPELQGLSLQDRDDHPFGQSKADLTFDDLPLFKKGLGLRRWRRRNIENYLLHPAAIARAAGKTEQDVRAFLETVHGLSVTADFTDSDCPKTLANTDGKIIAKNDNSILTEFGINYKQIAEAMLTAEIPEDPKTFLKQVMDLCR
jgi:energy-coupling factor transporter ATP-binding protein EcfA2